MAEETAENKAARQAGWDLPKWTLCYVQSLNKKKKVVPYPDCLVCGTFNYTLSFAHVSFYRM